jgi:rubrerythrin
MTSAYEIFARAERIERAGAELYRRIAERFPWSAEDLATLKRLAEEEIQHATRVRLLAAHYRNDPKLFTVSRLDEERLAEVEALAWRLADDVERGRWDRDLRGLKAHLADLEAQVGASHADVLARCADVRIAEFFRELARQDHEHHAMILASGAELRWETG